MSWLKNIFSATDIVDKGAKAIDALHLSGEEYADIRIRFAVSTMASNISRRIIACCVCFMWVVCGLVVLPAILFDHPKTSELINFTAVYITPAFALITSWYFWKGKKDQELQGYSKNISKVSDQ